MNSEQSRGQRDAIIAAKQRLATARAWEKSAAEAAKLAKTQEESTAEAMAEAVRLAMQANESATKATKSAQGQLVSAKSELDEAEKCLKDTYKKWEVIDIDDEESVVHEERGGSKGERGKSASPHLESEREKVVVKGAGVPEVNGTYKLCSSSNLSLPSYIIQGSPVFSKSVSWEGRREKFYIYQCVNEKWYISSLDGGADFYSNASKGSELPTDSNWERCKYGVDPAPQVAFLGWL